VKLSNTGLKIFQKFDEIYEHFKVQIFNAHYFWQLLEHFIVPFCHVRLIDILFTVNVTVFNGEQQMMMMMMMMTIYSIIGLNHYLELEDVVKSGFVVFNVHIFRRTFVTFSCLNYLIYSRDSCSV